ncbi:MAG TPA: SURF1 family protein [Albitalea sp.]
MRTFIRGDYGVLLATLAGVAVTASLGAWQLDRAAQKRALQQAIDTRAALPALAAADLAATSDGAAAQHHRRVRLQGRWLERHTVFLDNRQMDGRPGFFVVTPLLPDGASTAVLVQRGWAPRDVADRTRLPPVATPAGVAVVEGRIAPPPARLLELGPATTGAIRQNLDLAAFAAETGVRLAPLSIVQTSGPDDDGLARRWPAPAVDIHKHYGYAFQWFALGALMSVLYVWFRLVRPRLRRA